MGRFAVAVVLTCAAGLIWWSGPAQAIEAVNLTDQLTWDGSASTQFDVRAQAPFTVDLSDQEGAGLSRALAAAEGAGFVGFALIGQGDTADAFALAVRLPEPDGQGAALGTSYGREAGGTSCTACTFPAGAYQLVLLTGGEMSGAAALVKIRLVTGDAAVTALPPVGGDADVDQRGRTSTRADVPVIPGVSGFTELYNTVESQRGVRVDQRLVQFMGRTVPALLSWAEFCHGPSSDRRCVERESDIGDVDWTASGVTPFDLGPDETINSRVAYTSAGNIDFYIANHALFIGY